MEWKDTTSYSRSDNERIPRSWQIKSGSLIITIHRHRDYDPDIWLVSCYELSISQHKLKNKELNQAKNEALLIVKNAIEILRSDINKLI